MYLVISVILELDARCFLYKQMKMDTVKKKEMTMNMKCSNFHVSIMKVWGLDYCSFVILNLIIHLWPA